MNHKQLSGIKLAEIKVSFEVKLHSYDNKHNASVMFIAIALQNLTSSHLCSRQHSERNGSEKSKKERSS